MDSDKSTIEQRVCKTALAIVDPGASNPSGVAFALGAAVSELRRVGIEPRRHPAVVLMHDQLTQLLGLKGLSGQHADADFSYALGEVRKRVGTKCLYCNNWTTHDDDEVPPSYDDAAWERIAASGHAESCEWVGSRARWLVREEPA